VAIKKPKPRPTLAPATQTSSPIKPVKRKNLKKIDERDTELSQFSLTNKLKKVNIASFPPSVCAFYALARQTGTCGRVDANPFLTKTHEDFFRKTCRGQA
jgi:hypothetical protein